MSSESVYPNPEPPVPEFSGTILGIVVTLILMCVTMSVVIYYRRRFNRLKTELAHVHYHTRPDNNQGEIEENFMSTFYKTLIQIMTIIISTIITILIVIGGSETEVVGGCQ